jgi:uncharacterized membrane protein
MSINRLASVLLILLATLLSAFNGLMSLVSDMLFSAHESSRMWASIELPALLWILALSCFKFPKGGFIAYATVLTASIFLCVNPFYSENIGAACYQCTDDRRFALIGGALLLVNAFIRQVAWSSVAKNSDES